MAASPRIIGLGRYVCDLPTRRFLPRPGDVVPDGIPIDTKEEIGLIARTPSSLFPGSRTVLCRRWQPELSELLSGGVHHCHVIHVDEQTSYRTDTPTPQLAPSTDGRIDGRSGQRQGWGSRSREVHRICVFVFEAGHVAANYTSG